MPRRGGGAPGARGGEAAAPAAEARRPAAAREAQRRPRPAPATREVLRDGETPSTHLRQLSDSLRANAERLLLDIRAAHA